MKLKNKLLIGLLGVLISGLILTQCTKVLDKADLSAIPEQAVWNDIKLATAYVNKLYLDNMPGWPTNASGESDEAGGGGSVMYGQLTENSIDYWPYDFIRNINILLRDVGTGSLTVADQNSLKGQALFFKRLAIFSTGFKVWWCTADLKTTGAYRRIKG